MGGALRAECRRPRRSGLKLNGNIIARCMAGADAEDGDEECA